jgi:signal transduction histidine kinase
LTIGLLPAFLLAIGIGLLLSRRANMRVEEVNRRVARIVAGDLRQRLPSRGIQDPFDRLAVIVNGMLDEIEALIQEIAGVGDDIAHDLRTPLSRVRAILERGRENAATVEEFQALIERAMGGLDQCLAIITALLRITEIEHSRRLGGFGEVLLPEMMAEVEEFYAPMAEDRDIALRLVATPAAIVRGDRDLLFEAIANLVDNAVKFTPAGGRIELGLQRVAGATIIRVSDTGPGIGAAERDSVTKRFYRSDRSRHMPGIGLGLSLVAAIVRLHGFTLSISSGPGCSIEIACPDGSHALP